MSEPVVQHLLRVKPDPFLERQQGPRVHEGQVAPQRGQVLEPVVYEDEKK